MQYAIFDVSGFPTAFYDERLSGMRKRPIYGKTPDPTEENPNPVPPLLGYEDNQDCTIPVEALALTAEQYSELTNNAGLRRWENGRVVEYVPPISGAVTVLPAITLWERLTEAEADRVNEAMATQPVRTQRIFTTANTFRSDHELWPLLEQMANQLFGADRAGELLAA